MSAAKKNIVLAEPSVISQKKLMDGLITAEAASPNAPAPKAAKKKKKTDSSPAPIELNTIDYKQEFNGNPVLWWGTDNCFPQTLDKEAQKCNTLESGLKRLGDIMYGQGLYLCEEVEDEETGETSIKPIIDKDVKAWMKRIKYNQYYRKACQQLPRWGNVFPLYAFDENGKLAYVYLKDSSWCRLEKPHPDTAYKENIYISAQWENRAIHYSLADGNIPDELKIWITKVPLLKEYDPTAQMIAGLKLDSPIRLWSDHLKYETAGMDYGRAPWHAAYQNRWTGIAAAVPAMKIRLTDYALTINYMIGVHEEFWRSKYPDWDDDSKWPGQKRSEAIKEYQKEMEKCLAGKDNAYTSLLYSIFEGTDGKEVKTLVVDVLNNTLRGGQDQIPDVQMADGQILGSIGLDPSMIGFVVPGGKSSGGSGSNIREASLALNAWLKADRDLINEAFYTLRDLEWPNGEKDHVMIGVKDYVIGTLDGRAPAAGSVNTPE